MTALKLCLLGRVSLTLAGQPITDLASRKAEALLIYLGCRGQPQPRERLATLLWDDLPQQRALGNLSVLLSSLRKQQLAPFLTTTRQVVGLVTDGVWVDAVAFAAAMAEPVGKVMGEKTAVFLTQTLQQYQGPFLAGFYIRNAPQFEAWQLWEQERLHQLAISGWERLMAYHLDTQQWEAGIAAGRQLLQLDELRERGHRQLMQLLAGAGQRHAALAQFEQCQQLLADELGVTPDAETVALAEQIRAGQVRPSPRLQPTPPRPRHNLPMQTTPFVGREAELRGVVARLAQPDCRLLTLLGPGGVGKTRLALAAAAQVERPHGVWFVPLAGLEMGDAVDKQPLGNKVVTSMADALGFPLAGAAPPLQQLLDFLRQKELLLVLDNVEHLLAGESVTALMSMILQQAPGVKLLVTSRTRLRLPSEWLLEVAGLSYPLPTLPYAGEYEAVALFVGCVRRVRADFVLTEGEKTAVYQICQLVEGMPLGIELAATWARLLSCAEIAAEIGRSYDFLSSPPRHAPPRQQSLQAVFEYSWQLLTEQEQGVLMRLALFRGGFGREAAQAVAQADLSLLAALADKSFLRVQQAGRYEMHEMLRQYAVGKLGKRPLLEQEEARDSHAAFMVALLRRWQRPLQGGDQLAALEMVRLELENVRAGWRWVLSRRPLGVWPQLLVDSSETMFHFFVMRSWFAEGEQLLGEVVGWLAERVGEETAVLQNRLAARHGWLQYLCGQAEQGQQRLQRSLARLEAAGATVETIFCHNYLGAIALHQNRLTEAAHHLQLALSRAEQVGDPFGEAIALDILGRVRMREAAFAEAEQLLQRSLQRKKGLGDRFGMGFSLQNLGAVAQALGQPERARRLYHRSLTLREEMGDRRGLALCLEKLGELAQTTGAAGEAARLYMRAAAVFAEIGDVGRETAVCAKRDKMT